LLNSAIFPARSALLARANESWWLAPVFFRVP